MSKSDDFDLPGKKVFRHGKVAQKSSFSLDEVLLLSSVHQVKSLALRGISF